MPRSYPGIDGRIAAFAGCLLVGVPRPVADGVRITVAAVSADGRAVEIAGAIPATGEAALGLARRLRLRAGGRYAALDGAGAEAAFLVRAMLDGAAIRHVAGNGGLEALLGHAHGSPLRLDLAPACEAFDEVMRCPEGGRWLRIAGLAGAQAAARAGLPDAAAGYARDAAFGDGGPGDGRHYVLEMEGHGDLRAWVRVPGPEADPFELPEVGGVGGVDPFAAHAGRIADLGRAVDAMLGRRHCRGSDPARGVLRRGPAA